MSDSQAIHNNTAMHRYEAPVGDQLALAAYTRSGDTITFTHTEVPAEFEGKGIGSALAHFALSDARAQGLRVVAHCSFIAAYITRHPEFQDLAA
ncbi:MAG: N-acetyltransferase [Roseiflexaceae bacterium]|nr:N-acetyltransferase [Roseiflexaceae bacterium]